MFLLLEEHTCFAIVRPRLGAAGRSFDWDLENLASLLNFSAVGTTITKWMAAAATTRVSPCFDCRQES